MGSIYSNPSLTRIRSGASRARKAIPAAVQCTYAKLYGQRREVLFHAPTSLPLPEAKAAYGEWLAEVERRIAALRTDGPEEPIASPLVHLEEVEATAMVSTDAPTPATPNSRVDSYADISGCGNGPRALFDKEPKPLKVFEAYVSAKPGLARSTVVGWRSILA